MVTYWHEDRVLLINPMSATLYRIIADIDLSRQPAPASHPLDLLQSILDCGGPR